MLTRIANGRTDLVFPYLAAGGKATDCADDVSLLKWCVYYGDVSAMRHLLAHGAQLETLGDNLDLAGACYHGHWRLAEFLIENGADVNHQDAETGETPLHRAAAFANEEDIEELLAAGGRLDITDAQGDTPLSWASWYLRPASILALLLHGPYRIHPERLRRRTCEPADGSMERDLLGKPVPE